MKTVTPAPALPTLLLSIEEAVGARRVFEFWSDNFAEAFVAFKPVGKRWWRVTGHLGSWESLTELQRFFGINASTGVFPLERTTPFAGQGIAARR